MCPIENQGTKVKDWGRGLCTTYPHWFCFAPVWFFLVRSGPVWIGLVWSGLVWFVVRREGELACHWRRRSSSFGVESFWPGSRTATTFDFVILSWMRWASCRLVGASTGFEYSIKNNLLGFCFGWGNWFWEMGRTGNLRKLVYSSSYLKGF